MSNVVSRLRAFGPESDYEALMVEAANEIERLQAGESEVEWCVYEHAYGVAWKVDPPTEENARDEWGSLGELGHEVMPAPQAEQLRNAFAAGRLYGHRQAKRQP